MRVFKIEKSVRDAGFRGELSLITECGNHEGSYLSSVIFPRLREKLPGWAVITYDYDRYINRSAGAGFCLETPIKAGFDLYYLPRGLLTWKGSLPIPLREHWSLDIEDILRFQPAGVWWFGADALGKNSGSKSYCSAADIQKHGFANGIEARLELLKMCSKAGLKGDNYSAFRKS